MGSMLFAVLAVAAQLDRDYIREKTLEGQRAAAAKGNHGGRPKVIDDDMLLFAPALKDNGTPVPGIARKLVIKSGKNAGQHPSAAAAEAGTASVTDDGYPAPPAPRPHPPGRRTAHRRGGRAPRAAGRPEPGGAGRGPVMIPGPPHGLRSRWWISARSQTRGRRGLCRTRGG
jgi:hypothetical protein